MVSVVVIGASAAGLIAALKISSAGINTVLLEAKSKLEQLPADTLIDSMVKKCEINIPKISVKHSVKGFRLYSPSGVCLEFDSPGVKIDRSVFDEYFISKIKKNGGEIHLGTTVEGLKTKKNGNSTVYATKDGEKLSFHGDIVVVASGTQNSWLTGFSTMKFPNDVAYSYQVDMEGVDIEPEFFEFYIGHKFAPGWKAAISPLSESKGSVGIYARGIIPGEEEKYFQNFLLSSHAASKLKDGRITQSFYGLDPIATIPNQLVYRNVVVVGCAGGQSGLAYGMAAGEIAGETVIDSKGDLGYLKNYELCWKKKFIIDYIIGRLILQMLNRLSDVEIDSLFEILSEVKFGRKDITLVEGIKMCVFLLKSNPKLFFRMINITLQNILM